MAPTDSSSFTPAGWHVVTPRIVVHGAQQLVAFVNHVFGAAGSYLPDRPSVLNIGGSRVMISDAGICRGAMGIAGGCGTQKLGSFCLFLGAGEAL
jgi:hypothetical protein